MLRAKLIALAVVAALSAAAVGAQPNDDRQRGRRHDGDGYEYATVLESVPIVKLVRVSEPRQICEDVPVEFRRERRSGAGVALGALIGAAIGHHSGRHSGHEGAGTVIGAVVGSQIGREVSPREVTIERDLETRCHTVERSYTEERVVGYRVVYRYNGRTYETEMPDDPGSSLRVQVDVRPVPR